MNPADLKYTPSHEWAAIEGDICTVGITKFAVDQLTDVTHVEPKKVGTKVAALKPFGEIESVKAVFDLNAPMSGEIIEVNKALANSPEIINDDPYGKGWIIRIRIEPGASTSHLLSLSQYEEQIAGENH